jgi:SecD/SecF fusion protein
MDKHAWWKWLIFVAMLATSLALVIPPLDKKDEKGNVVRPGKIKLGLDLKGGTSFTVQIDEQQIRDEVKVRNPDWNDAQVTEEVNKTLEGSAGRVLEVLRNRIDSLGIAEPVIYPTKGNRVIIQLPGINETQRLQAEDSIRSAAFLEFRMVHEDNDKLVDKLQEKNLVPEGFKKSEIGNQLYYRRDPAMPDSAMDMAYRERLGRFQAPAGYEFLLEKTVEEGQTVYRPYFVNRRRELTGEYLKNASQDYKSMNEPVVKITFDSKGAKKFGQLTEDFAPGGKRNLNPNKYRLLAIILDGRLYSAPRIHEPIYGGKAEISGRFNVTEAQFLANILRAGALPAPVKIIERHIVSPTLGEMSARNGVGSGVYGCLAVILLAGLYYLLPGMIANFALVMNVVLLPLGMIAVAGFLNVFSGQPGGGVVSLPVLTLPGIAGIALTIGMAIDANVLIFERMREELRQGRGFASAIQYGYDRAFSAILDSNVTTIITAVILFLLGAGPIRGYAVTLTAGLCVSLYTAVILTRMVFNLLARKTSDTKVLKMFHLFPPTNIDFIGKRMWAIGASVVVIVVSWAVMVSHGMKNPGSVFGVEFVGGSTVTLTVDTDKKPDVESVRKALSDKGIKEPGAQYQSGSEAAKQQNLVVKVATTAEGAEAGKFLAEKFPDAHFVVAQQDDIGAQIGKELKSKAGWAMLWALIVMAVYITWRFEWGFAVGAFFSLPHDALITAGICHLLGFSMNMSIMASIMTIVGYSVNDTIVIFDRVRENLRIVRNKSFVDICNQSVNECLGRTVITTFLTVVVVVSLVVFGGSAIRDFAVAMLIGMISGVYSTVYIATPVVLWCYRFKTPDLGKSPAGGK